MSTGYHEQNLSAEAQAMHRALASLQEELEAVDWYNQRIDVSDNQELNDILLHNRNEEIEHAAMILEWLRRNVPDVDEQLSMYLFTKLPVTEVEDAAEAGEEGGDGADGRDGGGEDESLGLGSLR